MMAAPASTAGPAPGTTPGPPGGNPWTARNPSTEGNPSTAASPRRSAQVHGQAQGDRAEAKDAMGAEEERAVGNVDGKVYMACSAPGGVMTPPIVVGLFAMEYGTKAFLDYWLALWASDKFGWRATSTWACTSPSSCPTASPSSSVADHLLLPRPRGEEPAGGVARARGGVPDGLLRHHPERPHHQPLLARHRGGRHRPPRHHHPVPGLHPSSSNAGDHRRHRLVHPGLPDSPRITVQRFYIPRAASCRGSSPSPARPSTGLGRR